MTTFLLLTALAAGALVAAALIDRERRAAIAERARADRSADDARESAKTGRRPRQGRSRTTHSGARYNQHVDQ